MLLHCFCRLWIPLAALVLPLQLNITESLAEPDAEARVSFDTDPQWEGFRNRLLAKKLPIVRQDFGHRSTNFAAGKSPGEIGGRVQRAHRRAYYAKEIQPKSLNDKLSVSGRFAVTHAEGGSGAMIGWFNDKQSQGWRTPSSFAMRIDGNGGKYWIFFEYGTSDYGTGGGGAFEGERYQTTLTPPFLADGTVHDWSLEYDPSGNENRGAITLRIDDRVYSVPLAEGHKSPATKFDRFGIWNVQTAGDYLDVYFDDLEINGSLESFDHDPKWAADGNPIEYEQRVWRPYHEIGYSATSHAGGKKGEIGGIMFRDEQPAYYADRVGPFSLDDELHASGRIALRSAGSDSGVWLGFFGSNAKRNKSTPEYEQRQTDYLGILIEGPSRIGHYFRAGYSTSNGHGDAPMHEGTPDERPVIRPDGRVHTWSLHYDPNGAAGRGRITVTFDKSTHHLDLKEGERSENATLDRFGFFNLQAGGHHVEAYIDDVSYSKSRPPN
jgi:hypothetical protein